MAKDPAFLFYPGDWQGGTATYSRHLKGCYLDILIAQFNSGPLSIEEIKIVLGTDFAVWGALTKKFKTTENGLFFNERLELEKTKRKEYSKSRKDNINKRYNKSTYVDTHVEHMYLHMENENRNKDLNKKKEVKSKKFPFKDFLIDYGFDEKLIDEWLKVRKNKKATNSETAVKNFISEIEKRDCNLNEIMEIIVSKSWSGFSWEWLDHKNLNANGNNKTGKQEKFAAYFKNKSRESGFSN